MQEKVELVSQMVRSKLDQSKLRPPKMHSVIKVGKYKCSQITVISKFYMKRDNNWKLQSQVQMLTHVSNDHFNLWTHFAQN